VRPVLPDHDDDVRPEALCRLHFLDVHEEASVAANGEDSSRRVDHAGGDGAWQGEAHRAEAIWNQNRIGLVRVEVTCDPHLVRADIGEQDVLGAHGLAGVPEDLLGTNRTLRIVVLVPSELLLHLSAHFGLLAEFVASVLVAAQPFVQHPERMGQVADDLDVRVVVGIDLGGEESAASTAQDTVSFDPRPMV